MPTTTTTTPCPTENEGNIVNVTTCCDNDETRTAPREVTKNFILQEAEPKEKYCRFDVFLTKVYVTKNDGADGKAEVILTGYANDQSAVWPSMGCPALLSPQWGWVNTNAKIGSFRVRRGEKKAVYLRVDYIEADIAAAGAWEIGSDNGVDDQDQDSAAVEMVLECDSPSLIRKRFSAWAHRVKGGNAVTRVAVEFTAFPSEDCC